jgi:peroxiredoxin
LAGLRTLLKKDENVRLFAISTDPPDVSKEFATKLAADGRGEISFPLLSDPAYDGEKFAGIPHPAVYVIDKSGIVAWVKIESDYKNRPRNEEIRAALDVLK